MFKIITTFLSFLTFSISSFEKSFIDNSTKFISLDKSLEVIYSLALNNGYPFLLIFHFLKLYMRRSVPGISKSISLSPKKI